MSATYFRIRFGDQFLSANFDWRTGINAPFMAPAGLAYTYRSADEAQRAADQVADQFGTGVVEQFELGGRK